MEGKSMPTYNDDEFLQVALEQKFITPKELQEVKKIRQKGATMDDIGEILVGQNVIGEKQYNVVRTILRHKTKKIDRKNILVSRSEEEVAIDQDFRKKVLQEGLVEEEDVEKCLLIQKEMLQDGQNPSLLEIMLERGYINHDDLPYLEAEEIGFSHDALLEFLRKEKEPKPLPVVPEKKLDQTGKRKRLPPILEVIAGEEKGQIFPLTKEENSIGRQKTGEVCLQDTRISRLHCKINYLENHGWEIVDLESTYGVFVNGNKVEKTFLRNHDKIQIGKTILEIKGLA